MCGTGDEAYMTALCEKFEELFDIKTTYRAITAAQAGSARGDVWFGGSADTCRTLAADGKLLTYTPVHAADLTNAAYGDARTAIGTAYLSTRSFSPSTATYCAA